MAEIDLTPTEEMAANAARGLELRRKHGKGGTEIGVARARDISNRKNLSPETVRRMHAFFSRHEKNKAGGEDDAGYIAWLLWGGDSGRSWAKRKVEQMDKGENQRSDTYKEIAQRLGSAAKFASIDAGMMDGAGNEVVIRMADGSRATARYNRGTGKWSLEGHADVPAFAKVRDLVAHLTKQGMSRPGAKAKFAAQFEVGRTYEHAWANDSDSYGFWKVISRSGSMMVVQDVGAGGRVRTSDPQDVRYVATPRAGEQKRVKIHSDDRGEFAYPTGRYSMAPIIRATNPKSSRWSKNDRPGAKAKMQNAPWMQHVSNMLRDLTNERQRVQVWIAGPTTIKVAGMWMAYTRYGKGAAIASRMAYYLTQAAGTPGKYSGQDIKDSPRKGTNTTIWTVSNVPEDAVSYLKAWGIGTSPKAFAGFTGESAVAYARPGAKARMSKDWQTIERYLEVLDTEFGEPRGKAAAQEMMRAAAAIGGDEGARLKAAINTMATSRDYNARQRAYNAIASMMPFSRPGAKVANAVREGDKVSASDDAVSRKIRKLMDEGKPQKQAVAIALDLERRGEL